MRQDKTRRDRTRPNETRRCLQQSQTLPPSRKAALQTRACPARAPTSPAASAQAQPHPDVRCAAMPLYYCRCLAPTTPCSGLLSVLSAPSAPCWQRTGKGPSRPPRCPTPSRVWPEPSPSPSAMTTTYSIPASTSSCTLVQGYKGLSSSLRRASHQNNVGLQPPHPKPHCLWKRAVETSVLHMAPRRTIFSSSSSSRLPGAQV